MSFAEPTALLHCSFCEKSQQLVKKLIAGPGVYICNDCIDLCNGIINDEFERDPLDPLEQLRVASARADALVATLRADGVPWEEIAAALRPPEET
jgi:hypothetical protein